MVTFKKTSPSVSIMESIIKEGVCPNCGGHIREVLNAGPSPKTGERYCPNCGVLVWTRCQCGQALRYDDQLCPNCGTANPIYLNILV